MEISEEGALDLVDLDLGIAFKVSDVRLQTAETSKDESLEIENCHLRNAS
jgi:hypothetical protein